MDNLTNPQDTPAGAAEKDPVCGMMVSPARAKATHEHAGKMYYFCCAGCKEKFSAEQLNKIKTNVGRRLENIWDWIEKDGHARLK